MKLLKHKLYILTAAVLWSTIGLATVLGGDPGLVALVRAFGAGAVALIFFRSKSFSSMLAGLFLGILFTLYSLSAIVLGVGVTAFLLYTAPLWATIASITYGERPGRVEGLSLVLIGVALILMALETGRGPNGLASFATGLATGMSYGFYISVARYYSRRNSSLNVSLGALPYAAVITAFFATFFLHRRESVNTYYSSVVAGLYLAIFATVLPYFLVSKGLEEVKASTASLIGSLEPVLAAVWGAIFLQQIPTVTLALAYMLILCASILQIIPTNR